MMSAVITGVQRRSAAERAGIRAGETLLAVNGKSIRDVLDYQFYTYDADLTIRLANGDAERTVHIRKQPGEELGLDFETYLIDTQKSCGNKCIFCFIDQLPRGMRETLYFKDDDARLSFLLGNYISMTNLSDADVERIIAMRVSPLNISVHTTDPELRSRMLGNRRGGQSLACLYRFAEAGLQLQCQIVVCPGWNDGDQLRKTLRDLGELYPSVGAVAVVPVGLTRYRDGLEPLRPIDEHSAKEIIAIVDEARESNEKSLGDPQCYAADELYLKAHLPLPGEGYYQDFSQLENGVGLVTLFESELRAALEDCGRHRHVSPLAVATGKAAAPFMRRMIDLVAKKCDNEMQYQVFAVENEFFGPGVDVAGLVTGGDIIKQLKGKIEAKRLLIPQTMLRHGETVFLDDVSLPQLEAELGVRVQAVEPDGALFLQAVLGRK